jgi:HAD superfamily hydrolase (TIGR01548 family)
MFTASSSPGKRPLANIDAVLFDMDGTLIDERRSYREAIRLTAEFLLRSAVTMDEVEQIKRFPGFNNDWDATWALVGRRLHGSILPPDAADRGSWAYRRLRDVFQTYYLGDRLWRQISGSEPPFEYSEPLIIRETPLMALETLERLSSLRLGIATSRPRAEALMALRQHAFDRYFDEPVLVCLEDAPLEKPHPAPLRELVRRLGCAHPVYVGDTINDALAALRAGMPFIQVGAAPFGDALVDNGIRYRVADVNEIVDLCVAPITP